ncbi:LytTR family DNA-binding domain-containing protein [Salipiger pentaromativorans]|uniref:LytTR family DNA-binding domain-containing protein n=1 Tax=Salipiger pentaromativorans TaxID=2943193 RepID=UPI0021577E45|nr:LytTR family DNA-binding domain-containing protein [Salipiger pentaromativorans]
MRATLFEPIDLSAQQFLGLFRHRLTWRYMSLVLVILIAADPSGLAGQLPFGLFFVTWLLAFALYLSLQSVLILALAALRQIWARPAVYWPVISLCSFAPTLMVVETALSLLVGDALHPLLFERMVYVAITIIVFETIYMRFVLPRLGTAEAEAEADITVEAAPAPAPATEDGAERLLHIGGQPIGLEEVRMIEAREHHVHVHLKDRALTQRARLSDIVAQTRPEDGVQPHRSWWVARAAVRGLGRDAGKPVLELTDDSLVPVARGRLSEVRDWIDTYLG